MPVDDVRDLLDTSKIVLYLISRAVFKGIWVGHEHRTVMQRTVMQRMDGKPVVIPIIVEELQEFHQEFHPLPYRYINLTSGEPNEILAKLAEHLRRLLAKRKLFISYSHRDESVAKKIVGALARTEKS
jgi:hypothetical protein